MPTYTYNTSRIQRIAVFIDAQNLYHSSRKLFNRRVNFAAVLNEAANDRDVVRALAYLVTTEEGDESAFLEALHKAGIETRLKDLQIFSNGAKKADWDVGLAVDAIALADKVDCIVLVTGDGDFIPLVEYLRMHGIKVELVSFAASTSNKLIESVDSFIDLAEDPKKFLLGSHTMQRRMPVRKGKK